MYSAAMTIDEAVTGWLERLYRVEVVGEPREYVGPWIWCDDADGRPAYYLRDVGLSVTVKTQYKARRHWQHTTLVYACHKERKQ